MAVGEVCAGDGSSEEPELRVTQVLAAVPKAGAGATYHQASLSHTFCHANKQKAEPCEKLLRENNLGGNAVLAAAAASVLTAAIAVTADLAAAAVLSV